MKYDRETHTVQFRYSVSAPVPEFLWIQSVIASKRMLNAAGVRYYKYERTGRTITIDM